MSLMAALSESLMQRCCLSNIPTDCGLYKAAYWTLMLRLDIMSFHKLAVKDAPLSDVTTDGRPSHATHWCRKAEATSDDEASFNGIAVKNLVDLQIAVSRNLYP